MAGFHPDDDVARSIWNEMQRDAAPSVEEAKREHRKWLGSEGCRDCGESDPDRLNAHYPPTASCRAYQSPPGEPVVVCDECVEDYPETAVDRQIDSYRSDPDVDVAVVYDCGVVEGHATEVPTGEQVVEVGVDSNGEPVYEKKDVPVQTRMGRAGPNAQVDVFHVCGEPIREVVRVDGGEGDG